MMNDEYEHFGVKTNNSLMHSRGPWKKHKYISKGPNGYVYAHEPSRRVEDVAPSESWANRFDRAMRNLKATSAANHLAKGVSNVARSKRKAKRFANTVNNIEKVTDKLHNDSEEAKWEKRYDKRINRRRLGNIINDPKRLYPFLEKESDKLKTKATKKARKDLKTLTKALTGR